VDPSEFDELAQSPPVLAAGRALAERRPEKVILRVDRTDPSKNVVRGFRAFEFFLDAHPELHGRVMMLALLDPSRQDIPEYAEYLGAIQRSARQVNDRFQQNGWTPIDLRIEDNFPLTVAAYKQYDVLLVNAIYDGLNLVAKEGPLVNERDGVLILSENAGAHEELGPWALSVNPFDLEEQAQAINTAIEMPRPERRERIEAIREHIRSHDVAAWLDGQLEDLDRRAARATR
jgi:trehalose 6-phosphate synthase